MSIGKRLKLARKAAGLSMRALAEQVDVSPTAISKYERDLMAPSSGVLLRLAQALSVKTEFFLRPVEVPEICPVYRKRAKQGKKAEQAVLAQIQEWLERYLAIEALIPGASKLFIPPDFLSPITSLNEIEQATSELRQTWQLGEDPIENVTELLEDRGIKVALVNGGDDFDACAFWAGDEMPVIAVKRGLPGDRQRFNLVHELGHLVFPQTEGEGMDAEKVANRFAAAFLVPASVARYELGIRRSTLSKNELYSLKHKYGLSMQAWIYRAKDLGILSKSDATRHFKRFRREGWHRQEPGVQLPPEEPQRMTRLVLRAWAEDLISESRAAELLGQPLTYFLEQATEEYARLPVGVHN